MKRAFRVPTVMAMMSIAMLACGDAHPPENVVPATASNPSEPPSSPPTPSSSSSSSSGSAAALTDAGSSADAAPVISIANASCATPTPAGAPTSAPLAAYAGTCPAIAQAPASTTITSSGSQRQFIVVRPTTIAAGESLPVVFLWHWLGGSPEDMNSRLEVEAAVNLRRFIAVLPAPKGDGLFRWPFEASQSQSRVEEEATFFDDMLTCVAASLPINKECVSSSGVSAGALWTAQLAVARSTRLSSIVSLSGGTGGNVVRDWTTTSHRLPSLVLWGGPDDIFWLDKIPLVNFEKTSKVLISSIANDNHFALECIHNCGHDVPPFDEPPPGGLRFDVIWRFMLDHPYWLGANESPYAGKPLPPVYPSWCAIGKDHATPRPIGAACL